MIVLTFLLVILILLIVEAHYLVPCQCLLSDVVSAVKEDIHWCNLKGASSELSCDLCSVSPNFRSSAVATRRVTLSVL